MGRLSRFFRRGDREFFDAFEALAATARDASQLLDRMLAEHPDALHLAKEIRDLEHAGDSIAHGLISRLNATSSPPIDRGDVLQLTSALDDMLDLTEEVADLFVLYRIEAPMAQAQELAHILMLACREIADAVPRLRSFADLNVHTVEVNRLENAGDRVSREAVASLFDRGIDPMVVIRWKDVFERLEDAIDSTERAANLLEGIVLKNA